MPASVFEDDTRALGIHPAGGALPS